MREVVGVLSCLVIFYFSIFDAAVASAAPVGSDFYDY